MTIFIRHIWILLVSAVLCQQCFVHSQNSDFHSNRSLSKITFGSCNKHDREQPLWKSILNQNPDIWIWLGDAVYADTRIVPFLWVPSSLETMKERFDLQKQNEGYKALIDTGIPIIGVWDDHDFGLDGGGKSFRYRFQSQNIFLDFLEEPVDSIRRKREGMYVSYSYGTGDQIVKGVQKWKFGLKWVNTVFLGALKIVHCFHIQIILLDVRSHHVQGFWDCDILGSKQWQWLEEQLHDDTANLVLIGTGLQVLSDVPFIDKWMTCRSSLDRLVWMTQQRPKVILLSGDVHFSEVNCLNSSGTGHPLFEVTSSGLTHSCSASLLPSGICDWTLKNVVASRYRVSKVITDKSYAVLKIDWNADPMVVTVELVGETETQSTYTILLDDLAVRRHPSSCPIPIEQPNWYWKRVFWSSVVLAGLLTLYIATRIILIISRWVAVAMLKDLDTNIKRRIKKLRLALYSYYNIKNGKNEKKAHTD